MKPYIPQPCHEDWNAMSEKEKGRYCNACAKVVVDFTKMSDEEVIDYLQQHAHQKTCGYFKNEQLYQPEKLEINLATIPANLSFRKYFAIALLIAFTSFGLISCKTNTGKTVGEIEVADSIKNKMDSSSSSLKENAIINKLKNDTVRVTEICTYTTIGDVSPVTTGFPVSEPQIDSVNQIPAKEDTIERKTKGIFILPKK